MKKRKFKYIKLIAGSLALASIISACGKNNNQNVEPSIVYVYVTATPTPRVENSENNTIINTSETINSTVNTTNIIETEPSVSEFLIEPTQTTETATQTTETVAQTTETTIQTANTEAVNDLELSFNNPFIFSESTTEPRRTFGSDDFVMPYIEGVTYETLEDDNIDSLIRIYNIFATIDNTIHNFDFASARDEAIEEARQLIDFIFYGAEMNGVTFAELTEEGKQEAYARLQTLDERIMQYDPDYKTRITETYNRVYNAIRNFISTSYQAARDAFNSHIDIDVNIYPNEEPTESGMNAQREAKSLIMTRK